MFLLKELAAISDVRCEVAEVQSEGTRVLVLGFHGTCRDGSRGTPDATRMRAEAMAAVTAWSADALVFDMRGLSYRWGNGMCEVLATAPPAGYVSTPSAVVYGEDSRAGLSSLCTPDALFGELDAAIADVARRAREGAAESERVEDLLTLPILLREDLSLAVAVQAAARAVILAREHWESHWTIRLWVCGTYLISVFAATADDLEWAREELRGISVQLPGTREELGVVVAPHAELPARLAGLARFGG